MVDTTQRRGGVFSLNVGGTDYDCVDGISYILSTEKRETMIGVSGIQGYKAMPVSGQIKAKLRDNDGFKASDFANMTSVSVIGQTANGKSIAGTGMWTTEVIEVDPIEGTFEVVFEGAQVREITNA